MLAATHGLNPSSPFSRANHCWTHKYFLLWTIPVLSVGKSGCFGRASGRVVDWTTKILRSQVYHELANLILDRGA